jgi:hypothetical protein
MFSAERMHIQKLGPPSKIGDVAARIFLKLSVSEFIFFLSIFVFFMHIRP